MIVKFSLIMATIGRKDEIDNFIKSLLNSKNINLSELELIVVDQNPDEFDLKSVVLKYSNFINIVYLRSDTKGLSFCRNIGMKYASGEFIAFPDDDCMYYPDTLSSVIVFFNENPKVSMVLGMIYDRQTSKKLFKSWPNLPLKVNRLNFYHLSSSITIFCRFDSDLMFDENMGAGRFYGSCEDPDFIYRAICCHKTVHYSPSISVWHPEPQSSNLDVKKVFLYSSGFGYFVSKETNIFKLSLLILLIIKKIFQLRNIKKFPSKYFSFYFKGLYCGLFRKRR